MYDARGPGRKFLGGSSDLVFGLLAIGIALLVFGAVFLLTSKPDQPRIAASGSVQDHPVLTHLDDPATATYVSRLAVIAPKSAQALEDTASRVVAEGGGELELIAALLTTLEPSEFEHMLTADVTHADRVAAHIETGLTALSRKKSKWCSEATYDAERGGFGSPSRFNRQLTGYLQNDAAIYQWGIELGLILLDAVEAGRDRPVQYGPVRKEDKTKAEQAFMGLMTSPRMMSLMQAQMGGEAAMQRAAQNLDLCLLGTDIIGMWQDLPKETRGRYWTEYAKQARTGDLARELRNISPL